MRGFLLLWYQCHTLGIIASIDRRGRMLMTTEKLNQSTGRIKESQRTLLDIEDLGVSILQDIH
jgi:vesicle transport through interaction with t-SNAREs 1